MTLFGFFRRSKIPSSAQTAKDRLQILLAHERQDRSRPDYLPMLQKDILEVIRKYVQVASEKVEVKVQRGDQISTLEIEIEIEIELPGPRALKAKSAAATPNSAFAC
jgi:cell division topological specificity factor